MTVLDSPARRGVPPLVWLIPALAIAWAIAVLGAGGVWRLVAIGVVGLALFMVPVWKRPAITATIMPVLMIPPQFFKVFAYEVFLAAAFGVLLIVGWQRRSPWLGRLTKVEIMVLLMLAWGTFSFFWIRDWWWWLFGVRKYLMGFLALWVSWRLVRFVPAEVLLAGIPAGACALSLAVMAQASRAGFFEAARIEHLRTTATQMGWGQANFLAAIMALMLPTGIYLALNATNRVARILGWASIPMAAMLVTLAASRGGAVMLLAIALLAIFRSKIKPWMAASAAGLLLAFLIVGPGGSLLVDRFSNLEDAYSVVTRFIYFREAWQRTVDHWPLGMGMGQGWTYPDRLGDDDPHNYWLVVTSEFGLVGLILWLGILVTIYMRIHRMMKNPATEQAGRALQLTFVISQLNLMFEPTFQGLQYHALFYWVFGAYFGAFPERAARAPLSEAPHQAPIRDTAATTAET